MLNKIRVFFSKGLGFLLVGVALASGAAVWCCSSGDDSDVIVRGRELRSRKISNAAKKDTRKKGKVNAKRIKVATESNRVDPVKPDFSSEIDDESILTGKMKQIFKELQDALDENDKKRVFALVHKLQAMDEWPDDIPRSVKLKALDALAWFGTAGFAEAVGFLADSDAEVVQSAVEKFEEMLMDSSELGDIETSKIIQQITKVVHDRDALDTFVIELDNMRDTVKAETALSILDSGNQDAVSALKDNLEFIFSDIDKEEITRQDIEKFRKDAEQAYRDDPEKLKEDEEFYGPWKD